MDINTDILIQSIEHSNVAHSIARPDGDRELIYVNQAFLDQTGYQREEVLNKNCRFLQGEATDQDTVKTIRKALDEARPIDVEILNYKKNGESFWNRLRMAPVFDAQNKLVAFIGIQTDLTALYERNRIESERQKLEALGRMTGNINHEIKNAIQPIKLMTNTLRDWRNLSDQQRERCLGILSDNVNIADQITQETLRFSRKQEQDVESIELEELETYITRFVKNLLNSRTRCEITDNIDKEHKKALASIALNQLYQVMMNLINNALYAMDNEGVLKLNWDVLKLDSQQALALSVKKDTYLRITLEDNGCGMDQHTIDSALDPLFSTKPVGEGTGLGLSVSNDILKQWGGALAIKSEKNVGSILEIYLPIMF